MLTRLGLANNSGSEFKAWRVGEKLAAGSRSGSIPHPRGLSAVLCLTGRAKVHSLAYVRVGWGVAF